MKSKIELPPVESITILTVQDGKVSRPLARIIKALFHDPMPPGGHAVSQALD